MSNPAIVTFSAVPGWVSENLPPYFRQRPATVEALYAAAKSLMFGVTTVLGTAMVAALVGAGDEITPSRPMEPDWGVCWEPIVAALANPACDTNRMTPLMMPRVTERRPAPKLCQLRCPPM